MNRIKAFIVLVAAGMIASAGMTCSASADAEGYNNYVRVGIGMNQPAGDLDEAGYNENFDLKAAYGRYLAQHLVLEAAIDLFGADQDLSGSTATAGSYTRDDTIGVAAFLLTLKGEIPAGPITLSAGGGVGAYLFGLSSEIDTSRFGEFDVDDSDQAFGFHATAGLWYNVTRRFFIGAEGLYRWTQDVSVRKVVATVPVEYKGDLNGYTITASAGFRF